MDSILRSAPLKTYLKLVLLIMTIISTSFVIWAGFTGKEAIFPFLLCVTLFFSFSNLLLNNESPNRKLIFRVIFVLSFISVVLGAIHLVVGV